MVIKEWIEKNTLNAHSDAPNILVIGGERFLVVRDKEFIIDSEFKLIVEPDELEAEVDYYAFEFGSRWYYTADPEKVEFNDFMYLGEWESEIGDGMLSPIKYQHFGVHGEYESLNGLHTYDKWVKKAKFLGMDTLGICEHNTLAGSLAFQVQCDKADINALIGITLDVATGGDENYPLKLFAISKTGWRSLLSIVKHLNVDCVERGAVEFEWLRTHGNGLVAVWGVDSWWMDGKWNISDYLSPFPHNYFAINPVRWLSNNEHIAHLKKINHYLKSYYPDLRPILLNDSYYLEPDHSGIKEILNEVSGVYRKGSKSQWFKNSDEIIRDMAEYDGGVEYAGKLWGEILVEAIENTNEVAEINDFRISTGEHKLPKYRFLDGKDETEFFLDKMEEGLIAKVIDDEDKNNEEYFDRMERECEIIINAGFVSYFLILWDIVKWAKSEGIFVGPARGSVGGSLVSYLLDITDIDPVEYGLLFERFLNPTRVSGERAKSADALPDIDVDFESGRRDDVKAYMERRFGESNVVSVGTYSRLKLKSLLKDLCKIEGYKFTYSNLVTSFIPNRQDKYEWEELFQLAQQHKILREFITKNPTIVNNLKDCLFQTRSASVHPSAVIITPKQDEEGNPMNVWDWMPVKLVDGIMVSEWEGKYMDKAGFLKEDILGLNQLDKLRTITDRIRRNHKEEIVLRDIPLDDTKVFVRFKKGMNKDVFQFHKSGVSSFCRMVRPNTFDDLVAINALYRPGPMKSNAHTDYALIKHGRKRAAYDFALKEVTKATHGLYIFQEQIMQAVHVLGGLSLSEADEVRTIMKKFDKAKMESFQKKFMRGAIEKGCTPKKAENIWSKLFAFSSYGFNKSHASAYAMISYWCQWLKVHYPVEFWTTSLELAIDNQIPFLISEINRDKRIEIIGCDINKSVRGFQDKRNQIIWGFEKVKWVGNTAIEAILEARKGRKFADLDDFLERVNKSKVNKRVVEHLIIAGAFDRCYGLKKTSDREIVMELLYAIRGEAMPEKYQNLPWYEWNILQQQITGFGSIDYDTLVKGFSRLYGRLFEGPDEFMATKNNWKDTVVAGLLTWIKPINGKKGEFAKIEINANNSIYQCVIWSEVWTKHKAKILENKGKLVILRGKKKFDDWAKANVLYSSDQTKFVFL